MLARGARSMLKRLEPLRLGEWAMASRGSIQRAARLAATFVLILLVSAAAHHGFFTKWSLRDNEAYYGPMPFSAAQMLDGTAQRPYVYRQLLPLMADGVYDLMPEGLQEAARQRLQIRDGTPWRLNTPESRDPQYAVRYYILYYLSFAFTLLATFAVYRLAAEIFGDPKAALAGASMLLLMVPLFQSWGGFYYDFSEIFFMAGAALCAVKRWRIAFFLVALLGMVNKESFAIFTLCLAPFLIRAPSWRADALLLAATVALQLALHLVVRNAFAENASGGSFFWLWSQLAHLVDWRAYFTIEIAYGLFLPHPLGLVWLAFFALIGVAAWPHFSPEVRRFVTLTFVVNVPLYLLFCHPGETRNLSMLYLSLALAATAVLANERLRDQASVAQTESAIGLLGKARAALSWRWQGKR